MKSLAQIQEEERALSTAKLQLEFILANLVHLRKVDRGRKREIAVNNFESILSRGDKLSPAQMSYLDAIYEATMTGAGLGGANTHHDLRRSTKLRYG